MDSPTSERIHDPLNGGCPELYLVWRGRELQLAGEADACLSIGLDKINDLTVSDTYASRCHATLRFSRRRFELVDHSTNGTFVQLEDEQVTYVHRSSVFLWGSGYLSFGQPLSLACALKFGHA